MAYERFSQTSSGWTISVDWDAPREKSWRAVHPIYGERFFSKHAGIIEFTCKHMVEQFKKQYPNFLKKNPWAR